MNVEKMYKKDELTFALIWIAIYVVALSVCNSISSQIGIEKIVNVPVCIVLCALTVYTMKKLNILEKCGFRKWKGSAKDYLFFVPVIVVMTANQWHGAQMSGDALGLVLHVVMMLCVGFLEEVIFRGFLFNALKKSNKLLVAIVIAGVTFGFGHIVNLLNGREIVATLRQLVYASAIGIMLTMVFHVSKSLWPCIVFHGVFNSLCYFAIEGSPAYEWVVSTGVVSVICIAYAVYLWRKREPEAIGEKA